MSIRTAKTLLGLVAVCFLVGAPMVILAAIWGPSSVAVPESTSPRARVPERVDASTAEVSTTPTLDQFAPLWQLPLRRPLYDPPPPQRKPPPPRKPPAPPVLLVGTIVEPGHSMAIVRTAGGKLELKAVGDVIGPDGSQVHVERIDAELLVLRQREELITIPVQRKKNR